MARRTAVALAIIVPRRRPTTWVCAGQEETNRPIRACVQEPSGQVRIVAADDR